MHVFRLFLLFRILFLKSKNFREKKVINDKCMNEIFLRNMPRKYKNVAKNWQSCWVILNVQTGKLHYYLCKSEESKKSQGSIYLAGARITPSDEDAKAFTVNPATGRMIELRTRDARACRKWVDRLRAITGMYSDESTSASFSS